MNVQGAGIKYAAWRNWANSFLVLLIYTVSLAACDGGLVGVSVMCQRSYDMLNLPVRMMFIFFPRLEVNLY